MFNQEVLYHTVAKNAIPSYEYYCFIDTLLYASYSDRDLRKQLYFEPVEGVEGRFRFKASYGGSGYDIFNGMAIDEVYLIRAECYAREGTVQAALDDLNALLVKRWESGFFANLTAPNATAALDPILMERRKELVYRGTRWSDIRRLNKEPLRPITLKRVLDGTTYSLAPNDLRYALLIPREIMAQADLDQNQR